MSARRRGPSSWAAALMAGCLVACSPGAEPGGPQGEGAADLLRDRTVTSGVDFRHETGASGRKFLLEINAGCVALLDHDTDGDLDLYFGQGAPLPGSPRERDYRDRLYRNDGDWRFVDVTEDSGVSEDGYTFHAAAPDADGDGDPDLYVCNYGENRFLRNTDGRFADVTAEWGGASDRWSTVSAFADFDRDGDLDLYVANYVIYPLDHPGCGDRHKGPEYLTYCSPKEFPGSPDQYFVNEDGRFVERTAEVGMAGADGSALGLVITDLEEDGDIDLFVANDGRPNFLWRNDGAAGFRNIAARAGVEVAASGQSESCMGTDFADIDEDGDFDLVVANMAMETNTLYQREGEWFTDRSTATGLGPPSLREVGFGCEFLDLDGDGDPDLAVANGHVLDNAPLYEPSQTFRQPARVYRNDGRGRFHEVGRSLGAYFRTDWVGRGLAAGDLDDDGDPDLVIANNGDRPGLLENRMTEGRRGLRLQLVGSGRNRDALGALVLVEVQGRVLREEVRGTSSYSAFSDLRLFFGLDQAAAADRVLVRWPDGTESDLGRLPAGSHLLRQDD